MPAGDRTGPAGMGSGTGRGIERFFESGRGFRRGWGYAPGYRSFMSGYQPISSLSREEEIKMLRSKADDLKRSHKEIEKRPGDLEKGE